jgi:ribonuclease Z
MKSIFLPRLVNGPFHDPALYIRIFGERHALLFDLGDISRLSPSEIMRLSDVFISHTHIDHFIGFDHLLRIVLGRDKKVRFYGPRGLIGNIRGKLAGYTWNLVDDYRLELEATEMGRSTRKTRLFSCRKRFRDEEDLGTRPLGDAVLDTPLYSVRATALDHRTPCLAYALEEKVHINVNKDRLLKSGMVVGPWLSEMKRLYREGNLEMEIDVPTAQGGSMRRTAGRLMDELAEVAEGRKIVYISDIVHTRENEKAVLQLAEGADIIYCEAAFLDRDRDRAREKSHLTAAQAGRLAGLSGAGRLEVFHLSPRYQGGEEEIRREARDSFLKFRRGGSADQT